MTGHFCITWNEREWENGYCESFNGNLRDEFLNGKIFYSLKEAQILTERWRAGGRSVTPWITAPKVVRTKLG